MEEIHINKIGKYKILGELGRGGMGIVYKAFDFETNKTVAIKILKQNIIPNKNSIERFQREIIFSKDMLHPNIVPILEFGEDKGYNFYVMPFIEGQTLEYIIENTKINYNCSALIIFKIAMAIAYSHEKNVIHRDIKPANILVTDENVYITDFGLAKPEWKDKLTATGIILGTPHYMSPEQAQGMKYVDARSDIYSLGLTFYQMLTKKVPFHDDNVSLLLNDIIKKEPIPPIKIDNKIPKSLNYIVMRAMEKSPHDRYQTMEAFAEDIRCFLMEIPLKNNYIRKKIKKNIFMIIFFILSIFAFFVLFYYFNSKIWQNKTNLKHKFLIEKKWQKEVNTLILLPPKEGTYKPKSNWWTKNLNRKNKK